MVGVPVVVHAHNWRNHGTDYVCQRCQFVVMKNYHIRKRWELYFRIVYFMCVLSVVPLFISCHCQWVYASIKLATNSDYLKHLIMQFLCYNMRLGSVSIHYTRAQHRLPEIDGLYFHDTTPALILRDNIHSCENIL
jgi:hypothetical protein